MSKNALDEWQKKLNHLQTERARTANSAQKFELNGQIKECHEHIIELLNSERDKASSQEEQRKLQEEIQKHQEAIRNIDKSENTPLQYRGKGGKNPIPMMPMGIIFVFVVFVGGAIVVMSGGDNPPSAPVSNPGTTSSDPNQGSTSEPQTTSEQNSETESKKWCLAMKGKAEERGQTQAYIDDVKQKMESQNCSSLGVSLP